MFRFHHGRCCWCSCVAQISLHSSWWVLCIDSFSRLQACLTPIVFQGQTRKAQDVVAWLLHFCTQRSSGQTFRNVNMALLQYMSSNRASIKDFGFEVGQVRCNGYVRDFDFPVLCELSNRHRWRCNVSDPPNSPAYCCRPAEASSRTCRILLFSLTETPKMFDHRKCAISHRRPVYHSVKLGFTRTQRNHRVRGVVWA